MAAETTIIPLHLAVTNRVRVRAVDGMPTEFLGRTGRVVKDFGQDSFALHGMLRWMVQLEGGPPGLVNFGRASLERIEDADE